MPRQPFRANVFLLVFLASVGLYVANTQGLVKLDVLTPPALPVENRLSVILANPAQYNGSEVFLRGFLIKNIGAFFGPQYMLYEYPVPGGDALYIIPNANSTLPLRPNIALGEHPPNIDMESLVEYTFDGQYFHGYGGAGVIVRGRFFYTRPIPVDGWGEWIVMNSISSTFVNLPTPTITPPTSSPTTTTTTTSTAITTVTTTYIATSGTSTYVVTTTVLIYPLDHDYSWLTLKNLLIITIGISGLLAVITRKDERFNVSL